jgi:hypothetical protein
VWSHGLADSCSSQKNTFHYDNYWGLEKYNPNWQGAKYHWPGYPTFQAEITSQPKLLANPGLQN